MAYVNNYNLGRYWPAAGPQVTLYTPGPWLKPSTTNSLTMVELLSSPCGTEQTCSIELIDYPILDKKTHLESPSMFRRRPRYHWRNTWYYTILFILLAFWYLFRFFIVNTIAVILFFGWWIKSYWQVSFSWAITSVFKGYLSFEFPIAVDKISSIISMIDHRKLLTLENVWSEWNDRSRKLHLTSFVRSQWL